MAISLNTVNNTVTNHETRITTLEKTSTFLQKEIVYNNNTGTNSAISIPNLLTYDAVYVFVREQCHHEGGSIMIVLPNDYNRNLPANHVNAHNNLQTIISTTNKTISFVSGYGSNGRFISVVGLKFALKLYYNFSYNIIYKIYTKYKFPVISNDLQLKGGVKRYGCKFKLGKQYC